jgi:glycosyltransferase involved in cell wall biosynthesis
MGHLMSADWRDDVRWPEVRRVDWGRDGHTATSWTVRLIRRMPWGSTYVVRAKRRAVLERVLPIARAAILAERPAAIYATFPEVESVLIADQLGQEFRLPVVLDFRDQWSYQAGAPYRHYVDFILERALERQILRRAVRIVTTTQAVASLLASELKIAESSITVIPNGYDDRDFSGVCDFGDLDPGKFVVVYAGEMNGGLRTPSVKEALKRGLGFDYWPLSTDWSARSPAWFLQAARSLLRRRPELRDLLRLWLVGLSPDRHATEVAEFGYPECVRVFGRVPAPEAVRICAGANLLLLLQNQYFLRGQDCCVAIPGKLYTYLRTNRRILACVQRSEMAAIVADTHAGVVTPPKDVCQIEEALEAEIRRWQTGEAADAPRNRIEHWSRRRLTEELAVVIRSAVEAQRPSFQ